MIQVGQTIGNYKITAKLGEGGMGVVYLAEHPVIGRKVAMKAIHPELSRNPEVVSRFMTEAKSVNQIGNEHIVDISDFGNTPDGEFYFIMEFLQGEALADRLRHEKLILPERAMRIGAQVADALAASHAHGIIHRDLKPENIFLINRGQSADFVKVLDFGLAKLTQGEEKVTHKTRTGSVMGTPYYMAPEQCEGKPNIDHRADIYSLGVILFEMLTGKVPFGGDGYGEIIVKHIMHPPPSPRAINPGLSPAHEAILLRALSKNREDRFQSMDELRTALLAPDAYAAGAPALAASGPIPVAPTTGGASGRIGAPSLAGSNLGAVASPMPSTFGENAGELLDELQQTKSKRGIAIGAAVVGLAALIGGFLLLKGKPEPTPAPPATAAAVPAPAAAPPAPKEVRLSFTSNPEGAKVTIGGKVLGHTPVHATVPYDTKLVDVLFSKPGFKEKKVSFTPDHEGAAVPATLEAEPSSPQATAEPHGEKGSPGEASPGEKGSEKPPVKAVAERPAKTRPSGRSGGAPKKPSGGAKPTLDDDAILAPRF